MQKKTPATTQTASEKTEKKKTKPLGRVGLLRCTFGGRFEIVQIVFTVHKSLLGRRGPRLLAYALQ